MLEPIIKGLIEWIYGLIEDMSNFVFGDIIDVLTMDMSYFRKAAPTVADISEIILALGWALLLGNLVFQLMSPVFSPLWHRLLLLWAAVRIQTISFQGLVQNVRLYEPYAHYEYHLFKTHNERYAQYARLQYYHLACGCDGAYKSCPKD